MCAGGPVYPPISLPLSHTSKWAFVGAGLWSLLWAGCVWETTHGRARGEACTQPASVCRLGCKQARPGAAERSRGPLARQGGGGVAMSTILNCGDGCSRPPGPGRLARAVWACINPVITAARWHQGCIVAGRQAPGSRPAWVPRRSCSFPQGGARGVRAAPARPNRVPMGCQRPV